MGTVPTHIALIQETEHTRRRTPVLVISVFRTQGQKGTICLGGVTHHEKITVFPSPSHLTLSIDALISNDTFIQLITIRSIFNTSEVVTMSSPSNETT